MPVELLAELSAQRGVRDISAATFAGVDPSLELPCMTLPQQLCDGGGDARMAWQLAVLAAQ